MAARGSHTIDLEGGPAWGFSPALGCPKIFAAPEDLPADVGGLAAPRVWLRLAAL